MTIESAVLEQSERLIRKHARSLGEERRIRWRHHRSTGIPLATHVSQPALWGVSRHFNPYWVRKNATRVAWAIERAIKDQRYEPFPALVMRAEKPTGGFRHLSVFPVADTAISSHYFRRVLARNQPRFSPFSYAYRNDVGAQDAVERVARLLAGGHRFFSVEFDFSKYFDTVDHEYVLWAMRRFFQVTAVEQHVISKFVGARRAFGNSDYVGKRFSRAHYGLPQGSSVSLFLANVACHELDLRLADTGLSFVRYADDILVLARSDAGATQAYEEIREHCGRAGLSINFDKSAGIREFSPSTQRDSLPGRRGAASICIDILGHSFQYRSFRPSGSISPAMALRTSIRESSETRIRELLSSTIHSHLFRYIEDIRPTRINSHLGVDWDLVTCLNDLRDAIYGGGVSEDDIQLGLRDRSEPLFRPRGILAFYPQISDLQQLKYLDGWLLNAVAQAVEKRAVIIGAMPHMPAYPLLTKIQLLGGAWYPAPHLVDNIWNDVRVPSIVRAWKYARRGLNVFRLAEYPHANPELSIY